MATGSPSLPSLLPSRVPSVLPARGAFSRGKLMHGSNIPSHESQSEISQESIPLRRKDEVPPEADRRLLRWAQWTRGLGASIGWPERTLLARVMEEGLQGAAHGRPFLEIPDDVAIIDKILAKAPRKVHDALIVYYLRHEPPECKAKRLHISVSTFRTRVESGRWYVAGRLGIDGS